MAEVKVVMAERWDRPGPWVRYLPVNFLIHKTTRMAGDVYLQGPELMPLEVAIGENDVN